MRTRRRTRLGVRLIVFDRPGYGASTRLPGRGIAAVVDDAAALLRHLDHDAVHVIGGSGGGAHVLAFAARHAERVRAATVDVGGAPLEEDEVQGLIGLNRDGWYASREGWDALFALLAPARAAVLEDPLVGFRELMETAPASDRAVMDDPDWQRSSSSPSRRRSGREPKAGRTRHWHSCRSRTSIRPARAARSRGGTARATPTRR